MVSEREWTDYIQEDPLSPHLRNRLPSVVSIFRVPKFLKDTKREAYVPRRVSLGPYHHGSAELPPMGHHKGRAVRRMMKRFNIAHGNLLADPNNLEIADPNNLEIADLARAGILRLENEIRDSYEENIDCDSETLARMLCLDGCFLLEVLRTLCHVDRPVAENCYDPIFGKDKLAFAGKDILDDVLLVENQIPIIVLQMLLNLELNLAVDIEPRLLELLAAFILGAFMPFKNIEFDVKKRPFHYHHLLGLLHTVITSPTSKDGECGDLGKRGICIDCCSRLCCNRMLQGKNKAWHFAERIPHAVELRNAGIKFSPLQGGINDIKFDVNSATIFLPPISITGNTERVFRNLIAYEMCKPSQINYVTCYTALMNDLIDTEEDVALMRRMGVMSNWLGSDKEVADLFNGLTKDVNIDMEDIFGDLPKEVNAHYNNEMKVQIGKLMQDHFSSPWKALALTAASVILVLTVLQTIFTIISTYKK